MMRAMRLSEIAGPLAGTLSGGDCEFSSVSTDTRKIVPGDLFVALSGPNFDGNRFVPEAAAKKACGAIVSAVQDAGVPQLEVADTRIALGELGALNRRQFKGPVIAVTGSSGKTTVKEMIASILQGSGAVLATEGNLNNEVGVPLTLLKIGAEHRYAVIELGASAVGEIALTVRMAGPDVALITNAAGAHIEGFGGLANVVRAKGEIYDGLGEDGTAIVNLDDPAAEQWLSRIRARTRITFSLERGEADIRAEQIGAGANGCAEFTLAGVPDPLPVRLGVPGRHNVANALAAAAACLATGLDARDIVGGLESFTGVRGRLQYLDGPGGSRIIDDAYNANPSSFRAAIEVLASAPGTRVLVMGDMAELGEDAEQMHADTGRAARDAGIDRLFTRGPLSAHAAAAFGSDAQCFDDVDQLVSELRPLLMPGVTVLVKGSRSARMEQVVAALTGGED